MDQIISEFFQANNCFIKKHSAIVTRCPFCGDSQKPGHLVNYGQFYIYFDGFSKCYRCGKYVPNTLAIKRISQKIGKPIPQELEFLMQTSDSTIVFQGSSTEISYDVNLSDYAHKIDYLKKRMFTSDITQDALKEYKIVLDLSQFSFIPKSYYKNYIGFVTYNNNKIVLRSITSKHYRHYSLVNSFAQDYYTNKSYINQYIHTRTIVVGEGVFSILSSKLRKKFPKYTFIAALSKNSFFSAIKRVYLDTCIKPNVIVLKEKDVPLKDLLSLRTYCKKFTTGFQIYDNAVGKDTGEEKLLLRKLV